MQTSNVLTKMEAATQLSISVQTLDKMFKRGELPRIQITIRRVGVLQSDIEQHLEKRRVVKDADTETPQDLNNAEATVTVVKYTSTLAPGRALVANQ